MPLENTDRRLSLSEVVAEFPEYQERFKSGLCTQIHGGKRLTSAEEKLTKFGGVETIRKNLAYAQEQDRVAPYILQACRDGIMVPDEIISFVEPIIAPRRLRPATLLYAIDYTNIHSEEGEAFREVEEVTFIYRIKHGLYLVGERPGFETTQEGLRQLAQWAQKGSQIKGKFSMIWQPGKA